MEMLSVVTALQQELHALEEMLGGKVKQMERLEREIVELRKLVEAYRAVLEHRTRRKPETSVRPSRRARAPVATAAVVGGAVAGVDGQGGGAASAPSGAMPPRTPGYAGLSVGAAVEAVAARRDGALHADDFARAIWRIEGEEDLRAAKRTLNTELLRRVRKGSLERAGRNVYRRIG